MKLINYKSDFDFILHLFSCNGKELEFPPYDFTVYLYTANRNNPFVAYCKNGVCKNCYDDEGKIHIVMDSHGLYPGDLKIEFVAEIPNDIYPDKEKRLVIVGPTEIRLVSGTSDCPSKAEAELILPAIKGEPFTWEDFTPEQIEELQKPATEAAKNIKELSDNFSEAETKRLEAEQKRNEAESLRSNKETERNNAEERRITNENNRVSKEIERENAERERLEAEQKRILNEEGRTRAETIRVNSEKERNNAESGRTQNETERHSNEELRVSREQEREQEEQKRKDAETIRVNAENIRSQNELKRTEEWEESKTGIETAISNAETATNKANEASQNIEEKIGGNRIILDWSNDAASTRKLVSSAARKSGLVISYKHPEKGWLNEQYIGTTFTDAQWQLDSNWQNLATAKDITDGIKGAITSTITDDENKAPSNKAMKEALNQGKISLDPSIILEDIDTIYPQSNSYPFPFEKLKNGMAYRTYRASKVGDTKSILSEAHSDLEEATLVMRARSHNGNTFNCEFKLESVNIINNIEITSHWETYIYQSKDPSQTKRISIVPADDIDIMAVYLVKGKIEKCQIDDQDIIRMSVERYKVSEERVSDTLNLFKYSIKNIIYTGNWRNAAGQFSTNLIKINDVLTITGKPIITGSAQFLLCFDKDKNFLSSFQGRNSPESQIWKEDLPIGTEYIAIWYGNFPEQDPKEMFVYNGFIPFKETKGCYPHKASEQLVERLSPVGKNLYNSASHYNCLYWQLLPGDKHIGLSGNSGYDALGLMGMKGGESFAVSGIPGNALSVRINFYTENLGRLISAVAMVKTGEEYKGVFTSPLETAMIGISVKKTANAVLDYSKVQVEIGPKVTDYEEPIFGISRMCGYPLNSGQTTNSESASIKDIGTVFIFGDSITATNSNVALEGDPSNYPNNVLSISWVPDTMSRLGVSKWYNFALGGAVWTDVEDAGSFMQMSRQVNKAVEFSKSSRVVPDLVIVAMGANNNFTGDAQEEYDKVMHLESGDSAFGYEGIPYESLDRKQLPQAIRWNLHTLEKEFPMAVKMCLTPPQSANRDYITDKGNNQKIKLIELFANAYCFEVIPQHKEAGIVRQFETTGQVSGAWQGQRDLDDQVHPNANGRYKIVRYLANKIASRFMF